MEARIEVPPLLLVLGKHLHVQESEMFLNYAIGNNTPRPLLKPGLWDWFFGQ